MHLFMFFLKIYAIFKQSTYYRWICKVSKCTENITEQNISHHLHNVIITRAL
jgi:hypothetical protein